jgi:RNA polymerase sigma-70 factor (ECF subfamily)
MRPDQNSFLESEALRLAQQGNAAAFEFLYRLHRDRVYGLCLRMVKNPVQAEDLMQETFLAVLRGIREFRGESAFTTWLHQVTRNTVLMSLRRKKLEETSLEEIMDRDSESRRPPVELGTYDRHLEATADRMILRLAISKLSQGFRKALLLHDVHGYEHKEVAAILGWAPGTSKSQLHKARVRVREVLNKFFKRYRHNGNRSHVGSAGKDFSPPPAQNDNLPPDGERKSKPGKAPRKRERAIPSWCEPLDYKAACPSK